MNEPLREPSWPARLRAHLERMARDDESGAAMTEFVLVFPIQLMLTLVIIQFALLMHAHIVVAQAAFMGARAAAVADGMGASAPDAATRVVARGVSTLTSGEAPTAGNEGAPPDGLAGALRWESGEGTRSWGDVRQSEAYGHLDCEVLEYDGYVACVVRYDYVMWVPVANRFFSDAAAGFFFDDGDPAYNDASLQRGKTCFRVQRVGFVATPWRGSRTSPGGAPGVPQQ